MKKEINKKGELTSTMIVTIVLVIVGFGILLIIYSQISFTGQVDRAVCHESVILRATLPSVIEGVIPLKCKTQKNCVTSGLIGGKCEKDFGEKPKGVNKVKVDEVKDIEKLIAQEVVGCWSMMGEGKLSLFSGGLAKTYGVGKVYPTCVICSRIAFDEDLKLKEGKLEDINVLKYMAEYKAPNQEISYYEYLAGEGGKISFGDTLTVQEASENNNEELVVGDSGKTVGVEEFNEENSNAGGSEELAVLFMQISSPTHTGVIRNTLMTAAGVGVGGKILLPKVVTTRITAAATSWWTVAVAVVGGVYQQYSVAKNRAFTATKCGSVSSGEDEARDGCSVVRTVNYNLKEIGEYCSVIESIS